ncbi:MAG TPA: hypothetical protein VKY74_03885 [Chloroflexia bacterium]|nr:hypothetical protein [Chloroflexia bacterium]
MSTQNPPAPAVAAPFASEPEDTSDNMHFWVLGGSLVLLVFLAFLCVGFFTLGSLIGGHPMTDLLLTPAPR